MASNNELKNMLKANCSQLLGILALDGNINLYVKFSLYEELNSISVAIDAAVTIDGTNFNALRERTRKLYSKINELKLMDKGAINVTDK
jgi:hypothetical protein